MKPAFNINKPEQLREIISAFRISRIILTAYELDIFSHIATQGSESQEICQKIKTDARATDRIMNALCAIGLLQKRKQKFYNTPFSSEYLSRSSSNYLKGLMHSVSMWDTWSTMTEMIRTGKSQRKKVKSRKNTNWSEAFIGAMHERAHKQAKALLDKLNLTEVRYFLDIGGGSGVYAMEFVKRNNKNKATIFDLPDIIPITKKYVKLEGLEKRISFICGDYNKNGFGSGYDMAFLSAIIHINSPAQNHKLIKKCYNALNRGGQIVIQDHVMDEDRTSPFGGALFAMNMLVSTEHGDTYTEREISDWLKNEGFSGVKRTETFNNAMITAMK
ncbi:MAG: methyltransferase [Bacteroidales bacterium]|jgi:cyclopropane fatty-acyl-phospholipid synthase-like methyltransferase|nr:acetylserotonin O-methyltransferase [Bacteroidales bacterium]MDD4214198.1 methyltransferase [Bacteroidales bacterium]